MGGWTKYPRPPISSSLDKNSPVGIGLSLKVLAIKHYNNKNISPRHKIINYKLSSELLHLLSQIKKLSTL